MIAALVAEYRKFFSTRIWWILLLVMAGYLGVAAIGISIVFTISTDEPTAPSNLLSGAEAARNVYAITSPIGYVFALIVGSLAITTEFRYKTLTGSLLADPSRTRLLVAKVLSSIAVGLAYGLLATAIVVAVGAPILEWRGDGAFLGDAAVLETLAFSVLVMVLWTMMGVAFGACVPNQVAAIVVVLAFTQFLEPIARLGLGAFEATEKVGQFLPAAAADAALGSSFFTTLMGGSGGSQLAPWQGLLVMGAYIAVPAVIGRYTTFRRDIG